MKPFRIIVLPAIVILTGCHYNGPPTATTFNYAYAVPPPPPKGSISIAAQKIQVDAHTVHWKWTVRGDRAWTSTFLTSSKIILGQSAPIAHQLPYSGSQFTNIGKDAFSYEMTFTAKETSGGIMSLTSQTNEENVPVLMTGLTQGTITGGNTAGGSSIPDVRRIPASRAVKALLTTDKTLKLPINVPLYELSYTLPDGSKMHTRVILNVEK